MKLVRELIFPTFLLLFILLMLAEFGMFGITYLLYEDPIKKTKDRIRDISFQANLDSSVMLKKALIRKYNHITIDLIYIGKHMKHYLNTAGPSIKKGSRYETSMTNCSINTSKPIRTRFYNAKTSINEYIEAFSQDKPKGTEENDIINYLFTINELNSISKRKSTKAAGMDISNVDQVACYSIAMLKSVFIKNFILEHSEMTIRRFTMFIGNYGFVYPPENIEASLLNNLMPYGDGNGPINDNWINISSNFTEDIVHFIKPKLDKGSVILAACIKFNNVSGKISLIPVDITPVVCAEVILSHYLSNFNYNKDTIQLALFNADISNPNPLRVFYTNEVNFTQDINEVFSPNDFGKYKLTNLTHDSSAFTLFHLMYYSLFNKSSAIDPDLPQPEIEEIITEYEEIESKIKTLITNIEAMYKSWRPNQCDSKDFYSLIRNFSMQMTFLSAEETKPMVSIDDYQFIISPIIMDYPGINSATFLSTYPKCQSKILFYSITIVKYIPNTRNKWLCDILLFKIVKLSLFYLGLLTALVLIFYLLTQLYTSFLLRSISNIKAEISTFNEILKDDDSALIEDKQITQIHKLAVNCETSTLEDIFTMLKNIIIVKKTLSNLDFENKKNSYEQFVKNINDRDVKEVCMFILGYSNFKQGKYNQAILNFNYILEGLQSKEVSKLNSNEQLDSQIKEILKRSVDFTYVNYFTSFQGNNEAILPLLKIRQLSQEINYLCGLALLKASHEGKESKALSNCFRLQDPIEYFIKARDINHHLEINLIKQLFNMIMISRCFIKCGEYNKSMQNLRDALIAFNDLQKKLNVNVNKDIDPKVLLFANNAIFHSIMLEIANTAYMSQMLYFAGWIINKIFDTSIFLIDPVHLSASNLMITILQRILQTMDEKKKTDANVDNTNRAMEKKRSLIEDKLRFYQKISIRLHRKKRNKPNKKDKSKENKNNNSNTTQSNKGNGNLLIKPTLTFNYNNQMTNNSPLNNQTHLFNEIVLCISEKIFQMFNGPELKDIILKYLSKNFLYDDSFSYIQFAPDGKRTFTIVREKLKQFIEKLKNEKTSFKQSEFNINQINPNMKFTGLYAIIENALNCIEYPKEGDNMILMFINAKDIRFTSKKQCSDIVRLLNETSCSLILFSFEDELSEEKLEKLKSFLSCLVEGVFIQVKNYQVIKQVFQSLGSVQRYYNLNDFDFDNIDSIV